MSKITLTDGKTIEEFKKPYIIAEVNSSHNGSIETAKQMIDVAVDAGCDCVKFQSWSSHTLYSKTYYKQNPIAKRFVEKLSLIPEELKEMALYCKEKGIGFSSTPYSPDEVDFLVEQCDIPFVKISSMEINNPEYIRYIAEKQIPIIISTGMADYSEIKKAIGIIEEARNRNIVILHCVTIYPTPIEKVNLKNILALRNIFPKYPIGFSDHTIGDTAAVAATVMGAAVLEKHITLNAKKIGMDNQMAMEPEHLKRFVEKCKLIPDAMGTEERIIWPEELKQRTNMRRSIVAKENLKANDVLKAEMLDVKRPGIGIPPVRIPEVIGHTINKNIDADNIIMEEDINW